MRFLRAIRIYTFLYILFSIHAFIVVLTEKVKKLVERISKQLRLFGFVGQ